MARRLLRLRAQAHDQGVDEKAHHRLQLLAVAVVHRHPDAHVRLAAVALQQQGEGTQEQLKQGDALGLSQLAYLTLQVLRQAQVKAPATVAELRRARVIGRQRQHHRFTTQAFDPIGLLALHLALVQPLALPVGVVGVLHHQRLQSGRMAGTEGAVEVDEFVHQQAHGPAVGGDVVQREHQHPFINRALDHLDPHQGALVQVEQARDFGAHRKLQLGLAGIGQGHPLQVHRPGRLHLLVKLAILLDERGAQGFVPCQQGVHRPLQGLAIKLALQPHGQRGVIGGALGLQGPVQPLALLGERRRQALAARQCRNGRLFAVALAVLQRLGQFTQVGRVEHGPQRQVEPQLAAHTRDDLHGQ